MRLFPLIPAALIVFLSQPVLAQDWTRFVSTEDGFSANYPGQPKVETSTYTSEYRQQLPARVYTASDALGRYSTTVVDYRNIEKLHADRAAKCRAANGDGDSCQNDFRLDLAGATDHAVWDYMKRDGVKITHYMYYFVELVSGRLLQMTNPDQDADLRRDPSTRRPSLHSPGDRERRACPSRFCSCRAWPGPTRRGWRSGIGRSTRKATASGSFPTTCRRTPCGI